MQKYLAAIITLNEGRYAFIVPYKNKKSIDESIEGIKGTLHGTVDVLYDGDSLPKANEAITEKIKGRGDGLVELMASLQKNGLLRKTTLN